MYGLCMSLGLWGESSRNVTFTNHSLTTTVVSTCNILAEYVVAGYGLISLPSTVKAILS